MANGERYLAKRPHAWAAIPAKYLKTSPPVSTDGIEKIPSSGMIRGVGPVYAKRLIEAFGDKVFEIIENEPGFARSAASVPFAPPA